MDVVDDLLETLEKIISDLYEEQKVVLDISTAKM
jgi:hypothetical protein